MTKAKGKAKRTSKAMARIKLAEATGILVTRINPYTVTVMTDNPATTTDMESLLVAVLNTLAKTGAREEVL